MKALEKQAPGSGNVGLSEKPEPRPGPGEALIDVVAAGVCGTDLHIMDDSFRNFPPVTMGHEVTGVVGAVGSESDAGWVGARVACETFYSTCGHCPWCRDGRPNLCPDRRSIGSGADGGFAPKMVIPVRNLHRLPDNVGDAAGALCEPLACVCQSLCDPSVVEPGDDVLVTGPGTMGLLAAQVARAEGGRPLLVGLERDALRLEAGRKLGFDTAAADDEKTIAALGGGYGPQVVIECSGAGPAMAAGLRAVARGGRYVQIGQTGSDVSVPLALVSFKEIRITGGFASTPHSWRRSMELLRRNLVQLDPLVTEIAGLGDWERIFKSTAVAGGVKYVFDPRR
jgi:L-iditol 2-dehydrogenase